MASLPLGEPMARPSPDQPEGKAFSEFWQQHQEVIKSFLWYRSNLIIILLDLDKIIVDANWGFARLLGAAQPWRQQPLRAFLTPDSADTLQAFPEPQRECQIRLHLLTQTAGSTLLTCHVGHIETGYIIFGEKPLPSHTEVIQQLADLTQELTNISRKLAQKNRELAEANAAIAQMMRTDPLTGLANRRFLEEAMMTLISAARRHGLPLSLVMVDLDHFKEINDTWGHDTGDQVLREFGKILKDNTRLEDLAARYGGEEFVLLLPHTTWEGARHLVHRIQDRLASQQFLGMERLLTASFGISQLQSQDDAETLIKRADQALYLAKRRGRNRVEIA